MIKGTKRPMPQLQPLKLDFRASIHNRFDVEVIDAATGELKQKAQAFNVICDSFWSRLFHANSNGWYPQGRFGYVLYGKGSGTPAASDTALFNRIGALSASTTLSIDRRSGVAKAQATVTLNAEDAVGETLTELGIGYDETHCVTHAMLQDMEGNPISITKTDTDVINIYATIFLHWPDGGWYGGTVNYFDTTTRNNSVLLFELLVGVSGVDYGHRLNIGSAARRTGESSSNNANTVSTAVSLANKTLTVSGRFAAATANLPIRAVYVSHQAYYSSAWHGDRVLYLLPGSWFTPPAITAEAVGTGDGSQYGFRTNFPVRSGAKVYVDGAEVSGVNVRSGPPNGSELVNYFNQLIAADATALSSSGATLYATENIVAISTGGLQFRFTNGGPYAFENPFYSVGVSTFTVEQVGSISHSVLIEASDDCAAWTEVGTAEGYQTLTITVPDALRNKKFFRFSGTGSANVWAYVYAPDKRAYNIVFPSASPPASGAVITCDYVPDCIAKDSDHVFDMTVTLTLGEYQE